MWTTCLQTARFRSCSGFITVSYTHLYELVGEHYQSIGKDYAVFLFHGTYDVPLKASDKESLWESEEVYDFLVCTISPLEGEYEPGEPE